jgi:NAD(P)H-dependent flavin oxidoreductase YrpB (nitropropane dioxygenase family)
VANAARFRSLTGLSWSAMLREGQAMRHGRDLSWAQVLMAANTPMLLRAAMVEGRTDAGVFASGQVVGLLDDLPSCAELIEGVVTQAGEILTRLAPAPTPLP